MKSIISILASISICLFGLGQPTIDQQILFAIGDSAPVQFFTQGGATFDPGPTGANVNWDFSGVLSQGQPFYWRATDPSTTSWRNTFPQADMAVRFPNQDGEDVRYYRFHNNKLEFIGWASTQTGGMLDSFVYDLSANPATEIAFPFTYQQQVLDTASGKATIPVGGVPITVDRTIFRTLMADGYGTLTTPLGTFQDVLRIKMEESVEDRTFGQVTSTQQNRRYFWYQPSEKYLLLEMDSLVLQNAGGTFPSTSMFYRSGAVITSRRAVPSQGLSLHYWIDPQNHTLEIELSQSTPQAMSVQLLGLTGQVIKTWQAGPERRITTSTPIQELGTGVYVIQCRNTHHLVSRKIVLHEN